MPLRIDIHDADPTYVSFKLGGPTVSGPLYTHLRAVPQITEFRRAALRRATELYEEAQRDGVSETEQSGLGLLVLQRAMFAVEDLGGLLLAFADPPSWPGLVGYNLKWISGLFDALFAGGDAAIARAYLFPTDQALEEETALNGAQRQALRLLRDEALHETSERLYRVAELWRLLHRQAKKTVHGLGFIAGSLVVEPPGAGQVSEIIGDTETRPFVVSLETYVSDAVRRVNTELQTIAVDLNNVNVFLDAGLAACDAGQAFAVGRLHGLSSNHAYTLPRAPIARLPAQTQAILKELFGDE